MEIKNKKLLIVLRRCLNSRFILRSRSRELFDSLVANLGDVNSYFSSIGAEVVVDSNLGVARIRELPELKDKDLPQLGRGTALSPLESISILFLRKKRMDYFSGDVSEESPTVSRTELKEFLDSYRTVTEDAKFNSQIDRVVKNLCYWQVLVKKANLYEISPVCEIILNAEEIKSLKEAAEKYFDNLKKLGGLDPEAEEKTDFENFKE
jgi:hypothetical protein